jgi:polyferredoxin
MPSILKTKRDKIQSVLLLSVFLVIGLGWRYPLLGWIVPVVMVTGLIGSLLRGRYVCGNLCPRGGFFDQILSRFSLNKKVPDWLAHPYTRWSVLALLMSFMLVRILQNPTDIFYLGSVFWFMCVVTTAIGVALGLIYSPRSWCRICPIGTLETKIGGGHYFLTLDQTSCRSCKLCEKKCPMDIRIVDFKNRGIVTDPDCIKCGICVAACPKKSLALPVAAPLQGKLTAALTRSISLVSK